MAKVAFRVLHFSVELGFRVEARWCLKPRVQGSGTMGGCSSVGPGCKHIVCCREWGVREGPQVVQVTVKANKMDLSPDMHGYAAAACPRSNNPLYVCTILVCCPGALRDDMLMQPEHGGFRTQVNELVKKSQALMEEFTQKHRELHRAEDVIQR
jgi:hypothetical protein